MSEEYLKELAGTMNSLRSRETDPDYIGAAWKSPYAGRYETLVKSGMLAVLSEAENGDEKAWELTIVGKTSSEHIGYFKNKRSAAVALVKMIKGALDDCEKLRDELWTFVMANECVIM